MDISLAVLLANAFQIPVFVNANGETIFSSPDDYKTAASVLGCNGMGVSPGADQQGVAQFLSSPHNECFIYIGGRDGEIWLGPALVKPMSGGRISEHMRLFRIDFHKKPALAAYYQTLRVISERQLYYIGKLAEVLLAPFFEGAPISAPLGASSAPPGTPISVPLFSMRGDDAMFEHPPYFMELEMTRLVISGDMDSALVTMNRINAFNRAVLAADSVRSLKNSLICDCTFLARAAIAGGVPPEGAFAASDQMILKIEETHAIPELEKLERQNLIDFISLVHSYNSAHYSKPIRKVIADINRNLGEELSLGMLAKLSGLNPNYLCSLFRKETGVGLSAYITNRRVEEAKYYLRYTDNSILDIANFYRFSSQSHFTKRFSQVAGMTPLQYRKMLGGLTE